MTFCHVITQNVFSDPSPKFSDRSSAICQMHLALLKGDQAIL